MAVQIQEFFSELPSRLKRVTSGPSFIPLIDGLRFLAIVPVVLQHYSERIQEISPAVSPNEVRMSNLLSNGHIGVYLFFAISGFILALPFGKSTISGKQISVKTYYLRRLTRLEPPYLICMTALFVAFLVVRHKDFFDTFPHYVASIFYVHRIVYDAWSTINPPAWTLEVEVQFYLIAPFLAMGYFKIAPQMRRSILLLAIAAKIILTNLTTILDPFVLTLPYLFEFFFIGLLIADLFLFEMKSAPEKKKTFDFITIIALIVLFSSWSWSVSVLWQSVFLIALFVSFYGALRSVRVNTFLQNPWITGLGGMCYSIYLLHLGLIELFVMFYKRFLPSDQYWVNYSIGLFLVIPLILLVCIPFFLLIEKPCMNPEWPKKLAKSLKLISG